MQAGGSLQLSTKLRKAIPSAQLFWSLNGQSLASSAGVQVFDGRLATLLIGPLTSAQSGRYSLRVTSADGSKSAETSCNLRVQVSVELGHDPSLKCRYQFFSDYQSYYDFSPEITV